MTFVEPREIAHLRAIETTIKRKLEKQKAPTFQDAQEKKQERMCHAISRIIDDEKYDGYRAMAESLLEQYDATDLVAALLELSAGDDNHEQEIHKIKISAERPIIVKRVQNKKGNFSKGNSTKGASRNNSGGFDKFRKDKDRFAKEGKGDYKRSGKKEGKRDYNKDGKNRASKSNKGAAKNKEAQQ